MFSKQSSTAPHAAGIPTAKRSKTSHPSPSATALSAVRSNSRLHEFSHPLAQHDNDVAAVSSSRHSNGVAFEHSLSASASTPTPPLKSNVQSTPWCLLPNDYNDALAPSSPTNRLDFGIENIGPNRPSLQKQQ